jgi:hypothetical protein
MKFNDLEVEEIAEKDNIGVVVVVAAMAIGAEVVSGVMATDIVVEVGVDLVEEEPLADAAQTNPKGVRQVRLSHLHSQL